MGDTAIEWTDKVWNPTRGCSVVSPGCTNCYAMRMAHRLAAMGQGGYVGLTAKTKAGAVWTGKIGVAPVEIFEAPLHWKKPRRIFVNSMSDLFHESVPSEIIAAVFEIMADCPQHTFQVLTKRAQRMRDWCQAHQGQPLSNVWLGVSVEDQPRADERIPLLLATPAAVRFLSCEPLLGPLTIADIVSGGEILKPLAGLRWHDTPADFSTQGLTASRHARLDWVIAGGESGPQARPMHPDWGRALRDQCALAHVPFFFKQWGAWRPVAPVYYADEHIDAIWGADEERSEIISLGGRIYRDDDGQPPTGSWVMERVGKKAAGATLDGREHRAFPHVPS